MPSGSELRQLAAMRLEEAQALFAAGKHAGCIYLCGYVVELALKACICKKLDIDAYPHSGEISKAFKTHDFDSLVLFAGLTREKANMVASQDFSDNWAAATKWSPEIRYELGGANTATQAEDLLNSLTDPKNGVLTWLMQQW